VGHVRGQRDEREAYRSSRSYPGISRAALAATKKPFVGQCRDYSNEAGAQESQVVKTAKQDVFKKYRADKRQEQSVQAKLSGSDAIRYENMIN
jgi:hypothetical protein